MEQQKQKTLKFIHITKNAGSSIENRGRHCYWGKYHKEYSKYGHHTLFNKLPLHLRQKYDWFLVVRNPYTRIVSEMNCKFASNWNNRLKHHNKKQLNELLRKKINQRFDPEHCTGHFIEQYLYLNTDDPTIKIHILKYENLNTEFTELMEKYNLVVDLTKERSNVSDKRVFELDDLDKESIALIKKIYEKDFMLFNYSLEI
jgi:hypothetical protein